MSTEPIQEFILKDEQNLRIAAAVSEAWPGTRDYITRIFLERLSTMLLKELPEWGTDTWEQFFVHGHACFYLFKESWSYEYYVALQADGYGGSMQFGVQRDIEIIADRPVSPELLEAVRAIQSSARAKKWWDAQVPMRIPASDWRRPEVLWRMYADQAFLGAVAEQLIAVARATESILDRLTKK